MDTCIITSLNEYLEKIKEQTKNWEFNSYGAPWFRGQNVSKPPIPSLYRNKYDEFSMTRVFRERASIFGKTPNRKELDQWLFLMQHSGLPTRLLDWTESPLVALYFAVKGESSTNERAIWILHPLELNKYSLKIFFPETEAKTEFFSTLHGVITA